MKEKGLSQNAATALVIANMIGTGVFTTSGILLRELGSPFLVLLAWLGGGVTALLGTLCYGVLARQFPESGGEYLYLSRTFPPVVSFVAGWITLLVGFAVPLAALAFAFAEYLRPWLSPPFSPRLVGTCLLIAASLIHVRSIASGARLQSVVVGIEILLITLLASFGLGRLFVDGIPNQVTVSQPGNFGFALILVSYSYTGWNGATYIAGEVRDGARSLPRALFIGTAIVTLLYLALNTFFVFAGPLSAMAGRIDVAHVAAAQVGGQGLALLVSALVALAVAMCVSALTMTGPQVAARMARDGLLPKRFAAQSGEPPRLALFGQLALGLIALWTATFEAILTYVGISLGLCTAMTVFGLVRLRLQKGATLSIPGWPWVPILFLLFLFGSALWTIVLRPKEGLVGLGTILLFAVLHSVRKKRYQLEK
jgi:APA family basic amino acid/polyamine antiporter